MDGGAEDGVPASNFEARLQLDDINFSAEEAKVVAAEMDIAGNRYLTETEIEASNPQRIAEKLRATPSHLAELRALEIALEYEHTKIRDVERTQQRFMVDQQEGQVAAPTSPGSTLTKSPRRSEPLKMPRKGGFGSSEPRVTRLGLARPSSGSRIGRFQPEELSNPNATKTKREAAEQQALAIDNSRLRKELESLHRANAELQDRFDLAIDREQQKTGRAQAQVSALEIEKARLTKAQQLYDAGFGIIATKLSDLQGQSRQLIPLLMNTPSKTQYCELDNAIAQLLATVKQRILDARANSATSPVSRNAIPGLRRASNVSSPPSSSLRDPASASKTTPTPQSNRADLAKFPTRASEEEGKRDFPNGYGKFLKKRKGQGVTAKTATTSDMDEMMRFLFVESCQGRAASQHFISADGLLMSLDQFMQLLESARLLDDNVKLETVEPHFSKLVNAANAGRGKFRNRADYNGMVELLKEVAFMKFPDLSESGRWNKLQRSYLFKLKQDLLETQTALKSSSAGARMSSSEVVALLSKHRAPLLKMFRSFSTFTAPQAGKRVKGGNATMSAEQLESFAEEYNIVPGLISKERVLELRSGMDVDGQLEFGGFCEWLGVLAMSLYSTGYDDLAPQGFALQYPTLEQKMQRLFYDIDRRGVIFDLRRSGSENTPFSQKKSALNSTQVLKTHVAEGMFAVEKVSPDFQLSPIKGMFSW